MQIAIIGTTTPSAREFEFIYNLAEALSTRDHMVRTGGAIGVDHAAMKGAAKVNPDNLHVYLPWRSYNQNLVPDGCNVTVYDPNVHLEWKESIPEYHPYPGGLGRGGLAMMGRNYGIVANEPKVDMCFALPDSPTNWGGTGQGMRICLDMKIPLHNLRVPSVLERVSKKLGIPF